MGRLTPKEIEIVIILPRKWALSLFIPIYAKMDNIKKVYKHIKDKGILRVIMFLLNYIFVTNIIGRLHESIWWIQEHKSLSDRVRGEIETITFSEFNILRKKNRYWLDRWGYLKKVINIVKRISPKTVLELGPYNLSIVKNSDIMDKYSHLPQIKYLHDATKIPWPVGDLRYDLFIALQVWEHLGDKQQEAFKEVMRISKMAILSFPYKWRYNLDDSHNGIDEKKIAEWTLNVRPKEVIKVWKRIIYFFNFKES